MCCRSRALIAPYGNGSAYQNYPDLDLRDAPRAYWGTNLGRLRKIKAAVGSSSPIVFKPLPQDDPTRRRPDITKAKTLLGWEPKIQLREGLEHSLEFFEGCVAKEKNRVGAAQR